MGRETVPFSVLLCAGWLKRRLKMAECSHDCESCSANCGDRKNPFDFTEKLNEYSSVKKVIGVVSGKGGVGKSMVTALLASAMNRDGYRTAILDADITGPSIPKIFGVSGMTYAGEKGIVPAKSSGGIERISVNLVLEHPEDPVVWRGPVIAGAVKQFWGQTLWENEDYMFIDMPPGTGDVPLTVFQSIPLDGIVIVTSPQELVSMMVEKAVKMAKMMNIPVIGVVENMSYFQCPDCGSRHSIFGESHIDEAAAKWGIQVVAKLPMDTRLAQAADHGEIEKLTVEEIAPITEAIKELH